MKGLLKRLSDNQQESSLAISLRRQRFELFLSLVEGRHRPIRVLDVGGTLKFWQDMDFIDPADVEITLINLFAEDAEGRKNVRSLEGDARDLSQFKDDEFDVVFSNSVIEHVGSYEDQCKMASEVRRVGRAYFVQTPNYYFPLEPHFLFPFFQFLPFTCRVALVQRFQLGWVSKEPERAKAEEVIRHVALLKASELREMFPGAELFREKFAGLTKSLIVYGGF